MRKHLPLITGVILVLLGLFLLLVRSTVLDIPISPKRTASSWEVELAVSARSDGSPASLSIFNPSVKNVFRIVDRAYSSDDYSISFAQIDNRSIAMFSKKKPDEGQQKFAVRLKIEKDPQFYTREFSKTSDVELTDDELLKLERWVKELKSKLSDTNLFHAAVREIMQPSHPSLSFLRDRESKLAALEAINYPSRLYFGVDLEEGRKADSLTPYIVTVRSGKTYLYSLKMKDFVPRTSVLLWTSSKSPLASIEGLRLTSWNFTTIPIAAHLPKASKEADSWLAGVLKWYSINRLALATKQSFAMLLLLPVAALLVAFLRNIIGIKTFGTFMPAILALSFRETGLSAGLLLLITVIVFGVLLRMSFKYFRLLLVPRLCATLTCVVLLLFVLSIVGANFRIHALSSLSLFPVVILAMVIERLSIAIDEYGYKEALNTLMMSLIAATLAYFLISAKLIVYWFTAFPELNFSVLGLAILLGRYFGFRLTELMRFHSFAKQGV